MTTITRLVGQYRIELELDMDYPRLEISDVATGYIYYSGIHYVDLDSIDEDDLVTSLENCRTDDDYRRFIHTLG